jgi:hypothetical protein
MTADPTKGILYRENSQHLAVGLQIKHDQINFLSTCCRGLFVFGGTCVSSITHNRENKTNTLHKNPSAHPVKLSAHRHLFLRKPGGGDFLGGFPEMKTQRIWPRRYILSGHGRGYFVSEAVKNVKVKHTSSFWKHTSASSTCKVQIILLVQMTNTQTPLQCVGESSSAGETCHLLLQFTEWQKVLNCNLSSCIEDKTDQLRCQRLMKHQCCSLASQHVGEHM